MRKSILFAALLLPGMAQAVICKIVDPEGGVTYTDVPLDECPQEVYLPDYSRYAPRPIEAPATMPRRPAAEPQRSTRSEPFGGYTSMRIVQPASGATVRNNQGKVSLSIALEPALQPEHRLNVFLDGKSAATSFEGTSLTLSAVERGVHSLRAQVQDANGEVLIASPQVTFTMHRLGLDDSIAPALRIDSITGDNVISEAEARGGGEIPVTGTLNGAEGTGVTVTLSINGRKYTADVDPDGIWNASVKVSDLVADTSVEATAASSAFRVTATSRHTVEGAAASRSYVPTGEADYTPDKPDYSPVQSTPGRTAPAYSPPASTPGRTNPAFTPN